MRLSGSDALAIADKVWRGRTLSQSDSHTAHLGNIINPEDGEILDQAVAVVFHGPKSFTGDDTVEFSVHGSEWIQSELLAILIASGARLAEAGEFTRRAFSAGHIDLAEAEAVADLIASNSRASHRIAINQMRGGFSKRLALLRNQLLELASLLELELDFSEEDVEFASRETLMKIAREVHAEVKRLHGSFRQGSAIKNGIPVVIAGPTNVGKSTLLNTLLDEDRAIVSDIHGTTRDTVEDTITIDDYLFRFIDTAGLRYTTDAIEQIGIERTYTAINNAAIVINLIDPFNPSPTAFPTNLQAKIVNVINKIDIANHQIIKQTREGLAAPAIEISANEKTGIDILRATLVSIAKQIGGNDRSEILVTNMRHAQALNQAAISIERVIDGLSSNLSGDFIAQDLRETLHTLGTITGAITTPDILSTIFSRFCIGK